MAYIGQRDDEWEAEQRKREKAKRRRETDRCEICGKRVKKEGMKNHLRDAHQLKREPIETPKWRYTKI